MWNTRNMTSEENERRWAEHNQKQKQEMVASVNRSREHIAELKETFGTLDPDEIRRKKHTAAYL